MVMVITLGSVVLLAESVAQMELPDQSMVLAEMEETLCLALVALPMQPILLMLQTEVDMVLVEEVVLMVVEQVERRLLVAQL